MLRAKTEGVQVTEASVEVEVKVVTVEVTEVVFQYSTYLPERVL